MSSYRYCVLWIPTRLHQEIQPLPPERVNKKTESFTREYTRNPEGNVLINKQILLKDILTSDEAKQKVYIDITLLEENSSFITEQNQHGNANNVSSCNIPRRDIKIEAKDANKTVFDTLLLHCLDARRNGLFMYGYEVPEKYLHKDSKNKYLLNSNLNITNVLYYSIELFYHNHEYHTADSILHPFSSDVRINLNCPNNPALLHYLDEFEKKFLAEDEMIKFYKSELDDHYKKLLLQKAAIDANTNPQEYNEILLRIRECLDFGYMKCLDECSSILNIYIYYQSLFYSKHNKIFNLRYADSLQYELCEEDPTGCIRKSLLTLRPYHNQLLIPNNNKIGDESLNTNKWYKKAINIHNVIGSIGLCYVEVLSITTKVHLELIFCYSNRINVQTDNIKKQTIKIQEQADIIDKQTIEIKTLTTTTSELSSKLTKKTTALGILVGLVSSVVSFLLSLFVVYSPKDDLQIIKDSLISTKQQQQEQIDVHDQELKEIKKLMIDVSNEIKKVQQQKQHPQKTKSKNVQQPR